MSSSYTHRARLGLEHASRASVPNSQFPKKYFPPDFEKIDSLPHNTGPILGAPTLELPCSKAGSCSYRVTTALPHAQTNSNSPIPTKPTLEPSRDTGSKPSNGQSTLLILSLSSHSLRRKTRGSYPVVKIGKKK